MDFMKKKIFVGNVFAIFRYATMLPPNDRVHLSKKEKVLKVHCVIFTPI